MSYPPENESGAPAPIEPPPRPQPRPRERRRLSPGAILVFVASLVFLVAAIIVAVAIASAFDGRAITLRNSVAVIPIEGAIVDSRDVVETLHRYRDDANIEAVVIRVDSPGGGIVPSQEIHDEIIKFREESGKPVVAAMGSVAASGGYYIATACDRIIAGRGTVTGSIGVITQWMNVGGVLDWAHIEPITIASGEMKDTGSPYRDLTEEERAFYQSFVNELLDQFVADVVRARKLDEAEVRRLADGRIFTGATAMDLELVDELGSVWDAIDVAANLASVEEPNVIYPRRWEPGLFDYLFGSDSQRTSVLSRLAGEPTSPFYYRWK